MEKKNKISKETKARHEALANENKNEIKKIEEQLENLTKEKGKGMPELLKSVSDNPKTRDTYTIEFGRQEYEILKDRFQYFSELNIKFISFMIAGISTAPLVYSLVNNRSLVPILFDTVTLSLGIFMAFYYVPKILKENNMIHNSLNFENVIKTERTLIIMSKHTTKESDRK